MTEADMTYSAVIQSLARAAAPAAGATVADMVREADVLAELTADMVPCPLWDMMCGREAELEDRIMAGRADAAGLAWKLRRVADAVADEPGADRLRGAIASCLADAEALAMAGDATRAAA